MPDIAMCLNAGAMGRRDAESETLIPIIGGGFSSDNVTSTLTSNGDAHSGFRDEHGLVVHPNNYIAYGLPGNWINRKPENGGNATEPMIDISPCQTKSDRHAVCYVGSIDQELNVYSMEKATGTLLKGSPTGGGKPLPAIASSMQVRRLTPKECERLQGFSDGYTNIPYRKKPAPDGPRYKALGNSMAVPVMRWIGERIQQVENIKREKLT